MHCGAPGTLGFRAQGTPSPAPGTPSPALPQPPPTAGFGVEGLGFRGLGVAAIKR